MKIDIWKGTGGKGQGVNKLERTSEHLCYFVPLIPGALEKGIKVGRGRESIRPSIPQRRRMKKHGCCAHSSSQCSSTPLSLSLSCSACESDGRTTGEKRARGVPEHAQLKGVNRSVAAVGVV